MYVTLPVVLQDVISTIKSINIPHFCQMKIFRNVSAVKHSSQLWRENLVDQLLHIENVILPIAIQIAVRATVFAEHAIDEALHVKNIECAVAIHISDLT